MELSYYLDDHDEKDDTGPQYWSEVKIGNEYTDFSNDEFENKEISRCDTTLLVTWWTERQHPIEALNNFEIFDRLGAYKSWLGLDDELVENRIFASKSALNWVIYDWSVRKKRSMLG
jgi:hypothetical protein